MKITLGGGEKDKGVRDTVAQNDLCMAIRAQPKFSQ